jgi:N-dimethylarginine dimethylaminohydrolase
MPKRVLMCPPDYFAINYEINAWMHTSNRVDHDLALHQWDNINGIYQKLGFKVELILPEPDVPDLIFTANAGLVVNGRVMLSNFRHPERQPETTYNQTWFKNASKRLGFSEIQISRSHFEGEGDCFLVGNTLLAGYGFRSSLESHAELKSFFGLNVLSLRLVDPYFYHLDTCFCPLDDQTVMFLPSAFDTDSQVQIRRFFKTVIEAPPRDAAAFGLNAVSDGHNVVLSNRAPSLVSLLEQHGFNPITTPITEFHKSGGGVKCVTLDLGN